MAIATVMIAIVSAGTLWILINQLREMRIDQRPYVVTEVPGFVSDPMIGGAVRASITSKNIGKTPAVKYSIAANLVPFYPLSTDEGIEKHAAFMDSTYKELVQEIDKTGKGKYAALIRMDIAPNATTFISKELSNPLLATDIPNLKSSNLALFFVGIIRYTDAYAGTYETQFCYFYFGSDPKVWHICDGHNTIE